MFTGGHQGGLGIGINDTIKMTLGTAPHVLSAADNMDEKLPIVECSILWYHGSFDTKPMKIETHMAPVDLVSTGPSSLFHLSL